MNTPRTDAEVEKHGHGSTMRAHCLNSSHLSGDFADFARQLETELSAMTALADRLAEALEASDECLSLIEDVGHGAHMNNVSVARGAVQQAITAYESHKKQKP